MTNQIGIRNSNIIVPYTAATKQTKWINVSGANYVVLTGTGITTATCSYGSIMAYADSNSTWHLRFNLRVQRLTGTGARTS